MNRFPTLARASMQLTMFNLRPEYRIPTNAHARVAYGSAAQEIVCATLGIAPIAIDGSKEVCFDAERDGIFYEIKSVHRFGKLVIYDCRMHKEQKAGVPLLYAALVHQVRGARTSNDMWRQFLKYPLDLLVVPAATIHSLARDEPLRVMKNKAEVRQEGNRNGYTRKGYVDGYRNLGLSRVRLKLAAVEQREVVLFGQSFKVTLWR